MNKGGIKMKKLRWSLWTMLASWSELLGALIITYCGVSYIDVLIRHSNCASWNLIRIMVEMGGKF